MRAEFLFTGLSFCIYALSPSQRISLLSLLRHVVRRPFRQSRPKAGQPRPQQAQVREEMREVREEEVKGNGKEEKKKRNRERERARGTEKDKKWIERGLFV